MWGNDFYGDNLALLYVYQYALQQAVFRKLLAFFELDIGITFVFDR